MKTSIFQFTQAELLGLASRAATLERLVGVGSQCPGLEEAAGEPARGLKTLFRSAADDDRGERARLLVKNEHTDHAAREAIAILGTEFEQIPPWLEAFVWIWREITESGWNSNSFRKASALLRFIRLAASAAATRLSSRHRGLLTESVVRHLGAQFSEHLVHLLTPTIRSTLKPLSDAPAVHDIRAVGVDPRTFMKDFFISNPAIARLIGTLICQWLAAYDEMLLRLEADWVELGRMIGHPLGEVEALNGNLGDSHCGGRAVLGVKFSGGVGIVYRPRGEDTLELCRSVLEWMDMHGGPSSAELPRFIRRRGYAWAEWIDEDVDGDTLLDPIFYDRLGAVLFVLYAIQATDFHSDNILCRRSVPVLVDTETIAQPFVPSSTDSEGGALARAREVFRDSVLAIGILPSSVPSPDGEYRDFGALFLPGDSPNISDGRKRWRCCGPDEAIRIQVGFRKMYYFVMAHIDLLLAVDGPIARFRGKRVRVVLRPTALYATLLKRALSAGNFRNGEDFIAQFRWLDRLDVAESMTENHSLQRGCERNALRDINIPYFEARTDSTALESPYDALVINRYLIESGYDRLLRKLRGLTESDCHRQLEWIRLALQPCIRPCAGFTRAISREEASSITIPEALLFAEDIAADISATAISGDDGWAWLGGLPNHERSGYNIRTLGFDLYSGNVGIALFYSALYALTHNSKYADAALEAIRPLIRQTANEARRDRIARISGIGGGTGIGGLLYGLVRCFTLTKRDLFLELADFFAISLSRSLIEFDRVYDVMDGSAGAVFGLLTHYLETGSDQSLTTAVAAGQHLLRNRVMVGKDRCYWPSLRHEWRIGFAHGSGGISLALERLFLATGHQEFLSVARHGAAFESQLLMASNCTSRLRARHSRHSDLSWCRGLAGIALSRLSSIDQFNDDLSSSIVESALSAAKGDGGNDGEIDNLCCGRMGTLGLLTLAGERLNRQSLSCLAEQWARSFVRRPRPERPHRLSPGLFTGLAGFGYQVLAIASPRCIPSVLAFE